jgi:flagellar basal-body rod protein FlgG
VTIGKDGVVSVTLPNQAAPAQIGNIQLVGFVNPGGLQSVGENLYLETAASGAPNPNTPGTNGVGSCSTRPTWRPPTSMWPKSWC